MSRKKISVVGADYRAHYPRLYALTDEGGPRFEIQLSRHSAEKKGVQRHFRDAIVLKRLVRNARPLFLSLPSSRTSGSLILYFYRNSTAVKRVPSRALTSLVALAL